jgi:hypothetical protein
MPDQRPDYIPPWMSWPMNRWVWGLPPTAVILWFVAMAAFGLWFIVDSAIGGEWPLFGAGVAAGGLATVLGVIYVPRAWRAIRARRQR